ncbi:septum formation protein Maf [bacterium]|nr:septum formation protein Maf [bacterium]
MTTAHLVLASASASRAAVLRNAGLVIVQKPAHIDEAAIRDSLRAEGASTRRQAELLAETKAMRVSAGPGDIVLGADQMLDLDGEAFDKPASVDAARAQLMRLRGRTHTLETAIVACIDGAPVWRFTARPKLTMRSVSDAALDAYLADVGADVMTTVGGYKIEGRGVQLFDRIEGDHFSILGLPLLPLLAWLRDRGTLLR